MVVVPRHGRRLMPDNRLDDMQRNARVGCDPIFIADDYPDRTVAELPDGTKNAISHRGKSLRAMAEWLKERG